MSGKGSMTAGTSRGNAAMAMAAKIAEREESRRRGGSTSSAAGGEGDDDDDDDAERAKAAAMRSAEPAGGGGAAEASKPTIDPRLSKPARLKKQRTDLSGLTRERLKAARVPLRRRLVGGPPRHEGAPRARHAGPGDQVEEEDGRRGREREGRGGRERDGRGRRRRSDAEGVTLAMT